MKDLLKNKKCIIVLCFVFVLVVSVVILVVVNNNSNTTTDNYNSQTSNQSEPISTTTENAAITTEPTTIEPTTKVSSVPVEWTYKSEEREDAGGYKYEITYKVSPWILLSNTEIVNAYWKEISNGKTLPTFNDWGLKKQGLCYIREGLHRGGFDSKLITAMTDMYYCIGTVTVKNVTDGWDITSDNPRSPFSAGLGLFRYDEIGRQSYTAFSIGRVFYSNGEEYYADAAIVNPSMKDNKWGPVLFIIMAPENIVPAFPEGEYKDSILTGGLEILTTYGYTDSQKSEKYPLNEDSIVRIGLIGNDGKYLAP